MIIEKDKEVNNGQGEGQMFESSIAQTIYN